MMDNQQDISAFRAYDPEQAADLFSELQDCHGQLPAYRAAYQRLNRTFQKCLNNNTNFAGVRFNGPFAKTDYLLKENHAPRYLQRTVNDARVRLRDARRRTDEELAQNFAYDFKAVCQLVALVYHVPVPGVLQALFPADRATPEGTLRAECLRIVVNRWDATYIYANADAEHAAEVRVFYGGRSNHAVYKNWDWSYIGTLLSEGCQLNIVRPREHDGTLYPELFVWEPDFLVDISAVANSFESYGASPLNHLLAKLRPQPSGQPVVLGNLASQLLDEALCHYPGDCSYQQSVQKFFNDHALSLLTAELAPDFHAQAQQQKRNIGQALHTTLPAMLRADGISFSSDEIMVEPSFFSEMLGLQGRMDFLHLDHKVLIEQKSGKASYPETDPPREQTKHYVQLLLYMLLLRYNYREHYSGQHPFLLYSRYQNGLVRQVPAPDLVFAAMKLRNEIAASEYGYSREGLDVLTTLSADSLNQNHVQGVLWQRYQRPQIAELLTPIHQASALERAYYLRFLKFIETEHLLAKVGCQTKENAGFADKWHSSLPDKLLAGNIYCDLTLLSPGAAERGAVQQVVLGFTERPDHDISNFRTGDIVILYPYADGEEPDARQTMVFRATIECITANQIVLSLRAAQSSSRVFWHRGRQKWAIEHDFFESSFGPLYRGMQAFLSAPHGRRDLLLLQRSPQVDASATLAGHYDGFDDLVLRAKRARDLFLIIGPPGTGKTSFGLLNTLQEELLSNDQPVLLLSYTNRAVDEICSKLIAQGIDFVRMGSRFACEEQYRPYLLDSRVRQCANASQLLSIIRQVRVFVGTTTAFSSHIGIFRLKRFGLAIIDEASQILEPHLMPLLSATTPDGDCAIGRLILIGDHKQLPAVVQQRQEESAVSDPLLQGIHLTDCRLSLFERLLRQYRHNPDVTYMLTRQGRMHSDIARFPSEVFYQGLLQPVPLPHQLAPLPAGASGQQPIDQLLLSHRIAFMAVEPTPHRASDKVNTNEARAIAAALARIYALTRQHFDPLHTVGVIVPYRNQIAEIRSCIETYGIEQLHGVTIDTVERYQGSQRDYIVYGFTVQEYYQLEFLTSQSFQEDGSIIDRKLNVAMTRAREHLLLFGNARLLSRNATFSRLLQYLKSKNCYF